MTDDTAAIRQAILDNDATTAVDRAAAQTIYLPRGTYLISDSIIADSSSVRVTGAGRDHTFIKLQDNAVGFTDSAQPKVVLQSGNFDRTSNLANSGFCNYYQNFTLDTGAGNPGAIGIRYDVANSGAMQHVTIKTSDPAGAGKYGLYFTTSPGPAFVQDVVIEGFEHGIYLDDKLTNDLAFEGITLRDQTVAGITNTVKNIVVENLVTENVPVAIRTTEAAATVMIINSDLNGIGLGPAIDIDEPGFVYARDVTSSGFTNIVSVGQSDSFVGATSLREWSNYDYRVGDTTTAWTEDNEYVGLNLPVEKAPEFYNGDLATWANVASFVEPDDAGDFGKAFQRAIDSGAETVYFPYGRYSIQSPVVVRGEVRKIDFFFSRLERGPNPVAISVGDLTGDSVVMENIATDVSFEQSGPDTVTIRNLNPAGGSIRTTPEATGDLFIENAGAHVQVLLDSPTNVWGRSIDRANVDWVNNGGTLWCATCNIETRWSPSLFTDGSRTEIIGGAIDNLGEPHDVAMGPLIDVEDSYVSVLLPGTLRDNGAWEYLLRDSHADGMTNLYATDLSTVYTTPGGDERILLPMYVTPGYPR